MPNLNHKTAVILFNLGAPNSLNEVEPFLFNLFNDKAIIGLPQPLRFILAKFISKRRSPKSQKIYAQIGGRSPLLDITIAQAQALEKELSFFGDFKVFVAMRYNKPFAEDTIAKVLDYNPHKVILLPLYPQFSTATTASSVEDFNKKFIRAQKTLGKKISSCLVCCYPNNSYLIKSHANLIKQTLDKFNFENLNELRFLFSAHGLPQKVIDAGDPYVFQVEESSKKTIQHLAQILNVEESKLDFKVCYQSKVGRLQWTSPSLDFEIRRAALDKKNPVVIPISFVSDHSETLVELDIDYKNLAAELGIKNYLRVPALNIDGNFIQALLDVCNIALEELEAKENSNSAKEDSCQNNKNVTTRICPKNFSKCPHKNFCKA